MSVVADQRPWLSLLRILGVCHFGVEVEVEAHAPGSAARDTASPSASVSSVVVIGGVVFVIRHFVV